MRGNRRIALVAAALVALFATTFALASVAGWVNEAAVQGQLTALASRHGAHLAALAVIGLLIADLALPIPSSIVMTAAGALFGLAGAAASFAGLLLGAQLGYELGRAGRSARRDALVDDTARLTELITRHGAWILLLARAVPMVAETTTCLAGLLAMPRVRFLWINAAGALPLSLLYAWAGAAARASPSHLAWLAAIVVPALAFAAFGALARAAPSRALVSSARRR